MALAVHMPLPPPGLRHDVPLAPYTTWRIGGPARWFCEPTAVDRIGEIREACAFARAAGLPILVVGNGSNLLVADEGFPGLAIALGKSLTGYTFPRERLHQGMVVAMAGASLPHLARDAAKRGLGGLEFAIGVPGTVGGAVAMNAGAHGACIADVLTEVTAYDPAGAMRILPAAACGFGYRTSRILAEGWIVVSATFGLTPGEPRILQERLTAYRDQRRRTQPGGLNCGSVFKNPPDGPSAGHLIDTAGGKGMRVGGAVVSDVHANFIVNAGGATARDVWSLITRLQALVLAHHGVHLHPEVRVIGHVGDGDPAR